MCAVALFACSDEENTLDGTEPTEDDNPVKVVDDDTSTALDLFEEAMASGETLKQVTSSGSTTYVTFGNDETVTLSPEYYVVDATRRGRPLMGKSSAGTWTVDGIDMHVPVAQPGTGEQRIVCVCYDANSLTVYLNDDSRLLFHTEGDEGIYAFYIEPLYNDRFGEVVEAVIQGNTIEAVLPEGMESGALVATFCFRGQSVEVDGVAQQSRVTVNSFDEPVAYALTKSDGTVETYQVRVHSVRLPQIYITTAGGAEILDKENYVDCTVRIEDPSKLYTDGEVVEAAAGIRGRGNSTWGMPKKPYKFKLEEKERLLGMSKDKEWALLANYADKSMMRNLVAFKISEIVGTTVGVGVGVGVGVPRVQPGSATRRAAERAAAQSLYLSMFTPRCVQIYGVLYQTWGGKVNTTGSEGCTKRVRLPDFWEAHPGVILPAAPPVRGEIPSP